MSVSSPRISMCMQRVELEIVLSNNCYVVPRFLASLLHLGLILSDFSDFLFIYIFGCIGSSFLRSGFLQLCGVGLLFVAVHWLLTGVVSLVADHRLQARGLQQLWHVGSVVVARGLQSTGSVAVAHGLSCSVARLLRFQSSFPRSESFSTLCTISSPNIQRNFINIMKITELL